MRSTVAPVYVSNVVGSTSLQSPACRLFELLRKTTPCIIHVGSKFQGQMLERTSILIEIPHCAPSVYSSALIVHKALMGPEHRPLGHWFRTGSDYS
jgi:hypothetical protein